MTTPINLFDVIVVEIVLHKIQLAAHDLAHANELATQLWDDGSNAFDPTSLGRTDLTIANEVRS